MDHSIFKKYKIIQLNNEIKYIENKIKEQVYFYQKIINDKLDELKELDLDLKEFDFDFETNKLKYIELFNNKEKIKEYLGNWIVIDNDNILIYKTFPDIISNSAFICQINCSCHINSLNCMYCNNILYSG